MATRSLGQLTLDLVARTGGFTEPMDRASRSIRKNSQEIDRSAAGIRKSSSAIKSALAGIGAGLTISAFSMWIKSSIDTANAALDVAAKLGTTTEELTKLRYATKQSAGMASGEFDMALQRMTRRLAEAAQGGGAAKKSIDELGLDAQRLARMDPSKAFVEIVDAMADLEDQSDRVRHSFKFFDSGGVKIAATASQGRGAISELADEAERLGAVIDQDFAQSSAEFNANIAKIGTAGQGVFNEAAGRLVPFFNSLLDTFGNSDLQSAISSIVDVAEVLAKVMVARVAASILLTAKNMGLMALGSTRLQLSLAAMDGMSRRAALGVTALGVASRGASAALALVGGPAGLAVIAGYGLYSFASSASKAREDLQNLAPIMDETLNKLETMGRSAMAKELDSKRKDLELARSELERQIAWAEHTSNQQLAAARSFGKTADTSAGVAAMELVTKAAADMRAGVEVDFDALTRTIEESDDMTDKAKAGFINLIYEWQRAISPVQNLEESIGKLEDRLLGSASAARRNKEAFESSSEMFTKMSADIKERAALIGVTSEAEKFAIQHRLGKYSELSDAEAGQLQQQLALLDAKNEAVKREQEAAASAKRYTSEASKQADEIKRAKDTIENQVKSLEEQAKALDYTSEAWTLYKLKQSGATDADVQRAQAALRLTGSYEKLTEAQELIKSLGTDEEKALDLLRERKQVLDEAAASTTKYALSTEEYAAAMRRASQDSIKEAPTFGGIDAAVGGPSGELVRVAQAEQKLREWHERQSELQKEAYDQGLIDEETYQDRIYEINEENYLRLESLQASYTSASLANFSSLTGQAADMLKHLGHEGSMAYKLMFAASKASAMAQAIINTEQAATAALAVDPTGTLSSWTRGLGYMSVGMIGAQALTGMAHDGVDKVPKTGTWLLQKGERVTTEQTSAKLDRTLDQVQANAGSGGGGSYKLHVDVNVQAQQGVTEQDARRQGMAISEGIKSQFDGWLMEKMRPGGALWQG